MGSSSRELFPVHGEENKNTIRSGLYSGRNRSTASNVSLDSLGKFKSLEHSPWLSANSPTTTLSIGGDLQSVPQRVSDDEVQETILRLKTWSTAPDSTMQTSAVGRVVDSELEGFTSRSSKGTKRKRAVATRGGEGVGAAQGNSDSGEHCEEDGSEGNVLCWGAPERSSDFVHLTSNVAAKFDASRNDQGGDSTLNFGLRPGLEQNSGSSFDDSAFDFDLRQFVQEGCGSEDQVTLLQLGQTVGSSPRFASSRLRAGESTVSNVGKAGIHLGLAPASNSSGVSRYETTLDGVPVVDEGSSSARMSKTGGGFMPALLTGSPNDVNPDPQYLSTHLQHPTPQVPFPPELVAGYREPEEHASEQDQSMSIRASTSGGTTSTSGASGLSDRASKVCKFRGCSKGPRGASGLCIAHGGGQRCEKNGCNKGAEGRTVYCKAHGGGRRCQSLGCTKSAEGKTDFCIGHGGGRRCSHEGCDKAARGRSGLCIRHGGGKRCLSEGCTKSAEGYSGLCISHGGGRRCHFSGCSKGAQGSTLFCKAHGGGKRCMIQGCNKGAEGSTPLCKGHGGGKRCMYDGGGICTKSVHGGTQFCVAHGGGKRCQVEGCSKSARGKTDFCVRHGGGKRCKVEACGKSAQGSTDFCKAHGGGKRCQWGAQGSGFGEPVKGEVCDKFARGKTGLCAAHSAQTQDRRVHGVTGLGPGLTSGLFRGLVSGSGQNRSVIGTTHTRSGVQAMSSSSASGSPARYRNKGDANMQGETVRTDLVCQMFSTCISGRGPQNLSGNTSTITTVGLDNSKSFPAGLSVDHISVSSSGMESQRNSPSSVTPSFPANFFIGQSLIPPQVLVPLSMQTMDTGSSRLNSWRPPRPPTSSAEGGLNVTVWSPCATVSDGRGHGSSSQSEGKIHGVTAMLEGRVHRGRLMALLSQDGQKAGGEAEDLISLRVANSSHAVDTRCPNTSGEEAASNLGSTVEVPQRLKRISSQSAVDAGQFLAA